MFLANIDVNKILGFSFDNLQGEQITFFIACIIVTILGVLIGILARKYNSNRTLKSLQNKVIKLSVNIKKAAEEYEKRLSQIEFVINNFLVCYPGFKDKEIDEIKENDQKEAKKYKKLLVKKDEILEKKKLKKLAYKLQEMEYDIKEWPYPKTRGLYNVFEMYVEWLEKNVLEIMDHRFIDFTGYVLALSMFMLTCFLLGIMSFPNPFLSWSSTLTISIVTFVMIHVTSIHYKKWAYFHRYVEPVAFFLPINLLSMWSPIITLSLRLFGNALAGWCLSTLIYYTFYSLGTWFIAPIITPVLHAYFDVFSGCIQTIVFTLLTMIFVSQEAPEIPEEKQVKMGSNYR